MEEEALKGMNRLDVPTGSAATTPSIFWRFETRPWTEEFRLFPPSTEKSRSCMSTGVLTSWASRACFPTVSAATLMPPKKVAASVMPSASAAKSFQDRVILLRAYDSNDEE